MDWQSPKGNSPWYEGTKVLWLWVMVMTLKNIRKRLANLGNRSCCVRNLLLWSCKLTLWYPQWNHNDTNYGYGQLKNYENKNLFLLNLLSWKNLFDQTVAHSMQFFWWVMKLWLITKWPIRVRFDHSTTFISILRNYQLRLKFEKKFD